MTEKRETAAEKIKREALTHRSDCAIYNAPAMPAGPCDCGVEKRKQASSLGHEDGKES